VKRINLFRAKALAKEFPWLEAWARKEKGPSFLSLNFIHCDGIKVKRIDESLLSLIPSFDGATGSLVGISDGEVVRFIYEANGEIQISDPVKDQGSCVHNEAYRDDECWAGETVLEALERLQIPPSSIIAIVKYDYGYKIVDHHSKPNWRLTIYKPAKDLDLGELIEKEREKALAQVKAEADF